MKIGMFELKTEYEAIAVKSNLDDKGNGTEIESTITYEHNDIITEEEGRLYVYKHCPDYEIKDENFYITVDDNKTGPFSYERYVTQIILTIKMMLVDDSSQNSISEEWIRRDIINLFRQ